jgi:hypothetical protein
VTAVVCPEPEPERFEVDRLPMTQRLPYLLADAPPDTLGRIALAVAAMHEVDEYGRCRVCIDCQPRRWRWWRRGSERACPTRGVMWASLGDPTRPRYTPA